MEALFGPPDPMATAPPFPAPNHEVLSQFKPPGEKLIDRTPPEPPEQRRALVTKIQKMVERDKAHWKKAFARMREDMQFARHGAKKSWVNAGRYVANMVQRHIAQRTAALYAKNPRFVAKRKPKQDFAIWDGKMDSLMQAMQSMMMAPMGDPQAMALLADFEQGMQTRTMMDKVARTLELVLTHQFADQEQNFKLQMKQAVRRALTNGVAYIKVGFEREMQKRPETVARLNALETRLGVIERLASDLADGEIKNDAAEVEQLRIDIEALRSDAEVVKREGLVFDFPRSTAIIPDRGCFQLKNFLGCDHVTEEFLMTQDEVQEVWGIDLKNAGATTGTGTGNGTRKNMGPPIEWERSTYGKRGDDENEMVCVWQTYMRKEGIVYTTIQGYADFVEEPSSPKLLLERFWPWLVLAFNEVEDPEDVYPPSDVRLMIPMQEDHNRAREATRQVRKANLPKYVTRKGSLSKEDVQLLKSAPENAVLQLDGLGPNQKVEDLLQPMKYAPIDPAVFSTQTSFEDILRVLGTQEANLGGTSSSTATESSIAESSRMSALASNVDELDDLLSELANAGAQIVFREFDQATVQEIAGVGAVWPQFGTEEIMHEMQMEVQAGSSGRPNKMQEIQNFERLAPFLMQTPGMNPQWMLEQAVQRLDDKLDPSSAVMSGLPSITQMNAQKQLGSPGAADPNAQGPEGASNSPKPTEPAAQAGAPPQVPPMTGGAIPPPSGPRPHAPGGA